MKKMTVLFVQRVYYCMIFHEVNRLRFVFLLKSLVLKCVAPHDERDLSPHVKRFHGIIPKKFQRVVLEEFRKEIPEEIIEQNPQKSRET